jgi:hypothetical protein
MKKKQEKYLASSGFEPECSEGSTDVLADYITTPVYLYW